LFLGGANSDYEMIDVSLTVIPAQAGIHSN
jgi:hypothetical protein